MANPYTFDISDMIYVRAVEWEIKAINSDKATLSVHGTVRNEYPAQPKGYVKVVYEPETGKSVEAKVPMRFYPGRSLEFDVSLIIPIKRGVVKGELKIYIAPFDYSTPVMKYRKNINLTYEDVENRYRAYDEYKPPESGNTTQSGQDEGLPNAGNIGMYIALGLILAGAIIYIIRRGK